MPVPVLPPSRSGAPVAVTPLTVAARTPLLELRAAWRPDRYTRIANGSFAVDTAGWATTVGVNASAGVSITRLSSGGVQSARIVTDAVAGSGVHYDLGPWGWHSDARVSSVVAVRLSTLWESGGKRAKVLIGSEGTPAARGELEIDLVGGWQEHILLWRPQSTHYDAQLAVVTGDDQAVTMQVRDITIFHPLASQHDNGSFLADTEGWSIDGTTLAAAATSLTRLPGAGMALDANGMLGACARLVTTATAGSGADFLLGGRLFRADMTHRLRIGLRTVAGSDQVRLRFGSNGAADRADVTVTAGTEYSWHLVDWTPLADRTDALVSVSSGTAVIMTVDLSEVDVYDALDDLQQRSWTITRGTSFDGASNTAGTMGGALPDPEAVYTAWNEDSPLYPALLSAVRRVPIFARATLDGRAWGLGWGPITELEPDPYGKTAHLTAGDGLDALANVDIERPFRSDLSYAAARAAALTQAGVGAWQRSLDTAGPEAGTFYDGTDTSQKALAYLADLNGATGTIHVADPSPYANVGWVYRSTNRAKLTDASAPKWTMDDTSRGPLAGVATSENTLVTAARVSWQGYELLATRDPVGVVALPWGDQAVESGVGTLAIGGDPSTYPSLVPYMVFTSEALGSHEPPEPETVVTVKRVRGKRKRRRRFRWTDPVFPMAIPAGGERTVELDFSVPVEDMAALAPGSGYTMTLDAEPARAVVTIKAGDGPVVLTGLAIVGRPWLPTDEAEVIGGSSSVAYGAREPTSAPGADAYIGSAGQAEGLVGYLLWRYDQPRVRPQPKDQLKFPRMLGMKVGDTLALRVTYYRLQMATYNVASISHAIGRPNAQDWTTTYTTEALPADAGPWVTIGGGAGAGIGSSRSLAH